MGKIAFALMSLVAAVPAGFLAYLMVMNFLNSIEGRPMGFKALWGITLLMSSLVALMPLAIVIFYRGPAAPSRKKDGGDEEAESLSDEDFAADEAFVEEEAFDEEPAGDEEFVDEAFEDEAGDDAFADDEFEDDAFTDDDAGDDLTLAEDASGQEDVFAEDDDLEFDYEDFADDDDDQK